MIDRIGQFVPIGTADVEDIVQRFHRARYQPAVVFGDRHLRDHRPAGGAPGRAPGAADQSEPKRLYPAGRAVAHLVGYVSEVTERDLRPSAIPGPDLGTIVGKAGLEREYDDTLRGIEACATWR